MLQRRDTDIRDDAKHAVHIPHTMLAAAIDRFGGPEVLNIHALPAPTIGPREVLIALDTAGVGPWDLEVREGLIPPRKPRFPLVLGVDGAGVVMAAGSRVRRFKIGDWSIPTIGPIRKEASTPSMSWCRRTRSAVCRSASISNTPAR